MHTRITNDNVMTTDWARDERQRFLQSIPRTCPSKGAPKNAFLAPGLPARGVWMTDVSAMDRRSVKAHLAGRGDWRVLWWELHCRVHRLLRPYSTLEQWMYAFHRRHHALTLWRLTVIRDHRDLVLAIKAGGIIGGLRCAMQLVRRGRRQF